MEADIIKSKKAISFLLVFSVMISVAMAVASIKFRIDISRLQDRISSLHSRSIKTDKVIDELRKSVGSLVSRMKIMEECTTRMLYGVIVKGADGWLKDEMQDWIGCGCRVPCLYKKGDPK